MQKFDKTENDLSEIIDKLHKNNLEIYSLCNNNQENIATNTKVSDLISDNDIYIDIVKSYKNMDDNSLYISVMAKKTKIIEETLTLSKKISECVEIQKNIKAEQLKNINQKKNLLIYK